jgi:hypothetical protein
MSTIAAIITAMRAKGMSDTDILDVVQAVAEAQQVAPPAVNKPRSAGAIRQERYMNRKRGSVINDVTDVSVTHDDVGFPTPLPSLVESLPKTPLKGVKKVSGVTVPMRRKSLIPRDWKPSDENRADAVKAGLAERDIDVEAARFIDNSHSQGKTYRDFDAAWRNWCRNAVQWRPAAKSPDPPKRVWGSV